MRLECRATQAHWRQTGSEHGDEQRRTVCECTPKPVEYATYGLLAKVDTVVLFWTGSDKLCLCMAEASI